jgi:Tannase and feruloyl esterase
MDGRCFYNARTILAVVLPLVAMAATPCNAQGARCQELAKLAIPQAEITGAADVNSGSFTPPQDPERKLPEPVASVPRFCRVQAVARPSSDSEIHFEVWLPQTWNGKLLGVGNGGYTGRISYGALENGVALGYATASSDTGHTGSDLRFGAGHPEKIVDWGYRATHVTAEDAKRILRAYYDRPEQHAYFNGCSTGGEQALQEAQRFPQDYDGIVAGDPGNDRIQLNAAFLWAHMATHPQGKSILDEGALQLLHHAVLEACDAAEGVKDGVVGDPLHCRFDPAVLLCTNGRHEGCLSQAQMEAARKVYQGPINPHTGAKIMAGWEPGSELTAPGDYSGWRDYIVHGDEPARLDFWRYWVFDNPRWDWRSFDFDRDLAYAENKLPAVNADNPDLRAFKARGGKLIVYHGWVDPVGPPRDSIDYLEKVTSLVGGRTSALEFFRLFLVPGMSHCNGGPGYLLAGGARGVDDPEDVPKWPHPDPQHDVLSALDHWVQDSIVPEQILAFHTDPDGSKRTVPVCAYPKVALPKRHPGDPAGQFHCVER